MAKRFTDIKKWEDPWFRRLPIKQKTLWLYLCDSCDNAGAWKVDYELASFKIGDQINEQDLTIINNGKDRAITINGEYVIIKDFIPFQIGNIKGKDLTNLQKNCISLLQKYLDKKIDIVKMCNLTGSLPVVIRYKHKGKGISKGKDIKVKDNIAFIPSLKVNASYSHINIDQELGKMDAWLLLHPGRKKTPRFILKWLNRIEVPLTINKPNSPQPIYKAPSEKDKFKFIPDTSKVLKELESK